MTKNPAPVYVGMDVAKATLQVHLNGHQFEFKNDAKGHTQLAKKLAKLPLPHVVCEATGGYERPMVEACHKAKILVSVLNPAHTLAASQAQGKRAKTDPCDAAALTDYGQRFQPQPTAAVPPAVREITELTLWLKQLIDHRAVVKTHERVSPRKWVFSHWLHRRSAMIQPRFEPVHRAPGVIEGVVPTLQAGEGFFGNGFLGLQPRLSDCRFSAHRAAGRATKKRMDDGKWRMDAEARD